MILLTVIAWIIIVAALPNKPFVTTNVDYTGD